MSRTDTTIGVSRSTSRRLKALAAIKGVTISELVGILAADALRAEPHLRRALGEGTPA
jgi:hypothetical protein